MDRTATATQIIADTAELLERSNLGRRTPLTVAVPFNNRLEVTGQHRVSVEDHDGTAFIVVTTADRAQLIVGEAQLRHMPAAVVVAVVEAYL